MAPSLNTLARAKAIDNAMKMVEKEHAPRNVDFAEKYRGPYRNEQEEIDSLPFASPVLVYGESSKTWERPHPFVSKEGENVCVQLPHGRKIFRSHVVKPVTNIRREELLPTDSDSSEMQTTDFADDNEDGFLFATNANPGSFVEARMKKLKNLQYINIFKVVHRSELPDGE
ncbi:hypothetical protein BWQ96_05814 [Gracilariopsis chorda]|uniref:Uncharacterized protein n=1 Tax=Gracilariopsis chorda TaxID=448386 RepID=A0A2V3IQT5_9FLOR|nr:hypothetical protein BWQ96_05814 [Gracilariopsis chorda]|eukprot:PXF44444.1 hypothetical protein BWQ96_05814 [Gracilariopsis chorda]